jgi:hypothetical protein
MENILSKSISVKDIRINPKKRIRYGGLSLAGRIKLCVEMESLTA